jgi:hypothetical protein
MESVFKRVRNIQLTAKIRSSAVLQVQILNACCKRETSTNLL